MISSSVDFGGVKVDLCHDPTRNGLQFLVVHGIHPSTPLTGAGNTAARTKFRHCMVILNVLLTIPKNDDFSLATAQAQLAEHLGQHIRSAEKARDILKISEETWWTIPWLSNQLWSPRVLTRAANFVSTFPSFQDVAWTSFCCGSFC